MVILNCNPGFREARQEGLEFQTILSVWLEFDSKKYTGMFK